MSVLCVSTYHRGRALLMEILLRRHLDAAEVAARVRGAGIWAAGGRPAHEAFELLEALEVDSSEHRGVLLADGHIAAADLIVTAEAQHVANIAARWPEAYPRTFTLPELLDSTRRVGGLLGGTIDDWIEFLNDGRPPPTAYLQHGPVGEIPDVHGQPKQAWHEVYTTIDALTQQLVKALD